MGRSFDFGNMVPRDPAKRQKQFETTFERVRASQLKRRGAATYKTIYPSSS